MIDRFLLAIIAVVVLAWAWPAPGAAEGLWTLKTLAHWGVSLIFFFYGLRLSPEKMRAGLLNFQLHALVQGSTFLLFPLLALPLFWFGRSSEYATIWLGIYFLAALPSTVSSSVVMVSIAGGNMPGAIFNASLSALIGVFITPLWMALAMDAVDGSPDLGGVVLKLALQVLLPVILGLLLHNQLGKWAESHKTALRLSDQTIILVIVYTAFCDSFAQNLFGGFEWSVLILLGAGMLGLFALIFLVIHTLAGLLGMDRGDRITAIFCGSKKSLVHGTVMANILFAGSAELGLLLMPLMLYHALQIAASSIIARRMAQSS